MKEVKLVVSLLLTRNKELLLRLGLILCSNRIRLDQGHDWAEAGEVVHDRRNRHHACGWMYDTHLDRI